MNGCVCVWLRCRVEHVCTGLRRQQLQPSRDTGRRGRPRQQCAELGYLIWEAVGGPLWSPPIYGETQHTWTTSSGIIHVLMFFLMTSQEMLCHVCSCRVCVFLHRPSWGLRWVRRTFYSGRLVKNSGRFQSRPWTRYDDTFYLFTCWIILPVTCDSFCCSCSFFFFQSFFSLL